MIAEGITKANRPEAIEPYDKVWGVGVSGLDEEISPFPRVNKMLEKTKNATSMVDTQRAVILTEAYEKYKADPQIIKVAKAFRDIVSKVDIRIEEDELIVGEIAAPAWHAPCARRTSTIRFAAHFQWKRCLPPIRREKPLSSRMSRLTKPPCAPPLPPPATRREKSVLLRMKRKGCSHF